MCSNNWGITLLSLPGKVYSSVPERRIRPIVKPWIQGDVSGWQSGTVPLDWKTWVVVPLFKKEDQRVCSNDWGITLLSLPGKVNSSVPECRICPIVELWIQEEQYGFLPSSQCMLDSSRAALCNRFCSLFLWTEFLGAARGQRGSGLGATEFHLCFLQMMLSCWLLRTKTSSMSWGGLQPSVKRLG